MLTRDALLRCPPNRFPWAFIADLASEEKKRLEEKQRAARKNRSRSEEDWRTRCVGPGSWAWGGASAGRGCLGGGAAVGRGLRGGLGCLGGAGVGQGNCRAAPGGPCQAAPGPESSLQVLSRQAKGYLEIKVELSPRSHPVNASKEKPSPGGRCLPR